MKAAISIVMRHPASVPYSHTAGRQSDGMLPVLCNYLLLKACLQAPVSLHRSSFLAMILAGHHLSWDADKKHTARIVALDSKPAHCDAEIQNSQSSELMICICVCCRLVFSDRSMNAQLSSQMCCVTGSVPIYQCC